jgi:hypothetical protein
LFPRRRAWARGKESPETAFIRAEKSLRREPRTSSAMEDESIVWSFAFGAKNRALSGAMAETPDASNLWPEWKSDFVSTMRDIRGDLRGQERLAFAPGKANESLETPTDTALLPEELRLESEARLPEIPVVLKRSISAGDA